ncbi:MAG: hypothetical protein BAA03_16035 [Caldibacillus debilis]|nr:MAG: hypothetical protein BAA03_16035 [Caldibacillus debilis]
MKIPSGFERRNMRNRLVVRISSRRRPWKGSCTVYRPAFFPSSRQADRASDKKWAGFCKKPRPEQGRAAGKAKRRP